MSFFDDDPPPNGFAIVNVRELPEPPARRDEDKVYWEVDVTAEPDGQMTILASVTDSAAKRLPTVTGDDVEGWVREEITKKATTVNFNVAALYALSPHELHVPPLA